MLGAPGLDLHRYGVALTALARVLPGVETELIRHDVHRDVPDGSIGAVASKLLDDCRDLGLHVGDAHAPLECEFHEPGSWWGASYVLHGSRLGATEIADRLARDLPGAPRSYFDAAADGARPSWFAFRNTARNAFAAGGADLGRAVESARSVFAALLREFDLAATSAHARADGRVA